MEARAKGPALVSGTHLYLVPFPADLTRAHGLLDRGWCRLDEETIALDGSRSAGWEQHTALLGPMQEDQAPAGAQLAFAATPMGAWTDLLPREAHAPHAPWARAPDAHAGEPMLGDPAPMDASPSSSQLSWSATLCPLCAGILCASALVLHSCILSLLQPPAA